MKNIFKFFGLLSLIGFSFFYTDKVMDVVLEQDNIMIDINRVKDQYIILPVDASILEDGMIPGMNGREVNVEKSYNNMRSIGVFQTNYFVFDKIKPSVSMLDNYEKYIIQGNNSKHMVSLIFILKDDKYLDELYEIIVQKNIKVNFFVDYKFLNTNSTMVKEFKNANIYSYGSNGEYSPDTLLFSNNLIERITKQEACFCLTKERNERTLDLCAKNEMFTIIPNLYIKTGIYNEVRDKVSSGSMLLIDINSYNIEELEITIDYIRAKGLKISYLSELLNEELIIQDIDT